MKTFEVGIKVEILYSGNDSAADWTPATVVNVVKPNIKGVGESGNVVKLDNGRHVTVTESGMIRAA